jgi:hypothetical protein
VSEPVFIFDGTDVAVQPSVDAAAGWLEAVDIDDRADDIFGADGTVYRPSVVDGLVTLTATSDKRPDELHRRLSGFLSHPSVGLDPGLAEKPSEVAVLLAERQRAELWPRWPKWLHRLVHRN